MKRIAIIGGGPAGCVCAYYALKNSQNYVTVYDYRPLMKTIIPTGNGRCNFTYGEFDFKELVSYYPRGEKFLYSIFSCYGVRETLNLFDELDIKYYMQDDFRYFPVSNSSKEIQKIFSDRLLKNKKFKYVRQKISDIKKLFDEFDCVVVATGGNEKFLAEIEKLGQKIISFRPSLNALTVENSYLYQLPGVSLKNVSAYLSNKNTILNGDILLTHNSVSGPLIYKISSLNAFEELPYSVLLNFTEFDDNYEFEKYFIEIINKNNNKNLVNVLSEFVPNSFAQLLLSLCKITNDIKCNMLSKADRKLLVNLLCNFELKITGIRKYGETVMAGGVDTNFINPKTMESKIIKKLFFVGEIINVDGYCGGFNLQNCWSTGAICGKYLAGC